MAYEQFRETVERVAKKSPSKEQMESFIERTKNMKISGDRAFQAFVLCVKLLDLLDTNLMKELMRQSEESDVKLTSGILELVGEEPSRIATMWGMGGIPSSFDMNYVYRETPGLAHLGMVDLISVEKKNGKYHIENVDRRTGIEAIRRYLELSGR